MGLFETVNLLAVLLGARRPQWVDQTANTAVAHGIFDDTDPPAAGAGTYLEDSPKTLLTMSTREDPARRTVYIVITYDAASTYNFQVATASASAVPANGAGISATYTDIRDAFNTDASAVVSASVTTLNGVECVKVTGLASTDWTFAASSVSGGAGTVTVFSDCGAVDVAVWGVPKSPNHPGGSSAWRKLKGGLLGTSGTFTLAAGTDGGFMERLDTAGIDRLVVRPMGAIGTITETIGTGVTAYYRPTIGVGPSVQE